MQPDDGQADGIAPTRQTGWGPLHRTDPVLNNQASGTTAPDGTVADTGTTVVGLTTGDAVVLAADRRASVGGGRFVASKEVRKVEPVHPTAAAALSGAVGHIQHYVRSLRAETALYEDRRGERMSVEALSTLAGNVLRSTPLRVTPLLGGVDADGPRVFGLDGGGGVLADEYAAAGSGMQLAYGVLEREYEPGLEPTTARGVAARAVESASERDTASGDGVAVATATTKGVDLATFDDVAEVGA